ncbi:MAG: penicillin acylase family protein [Blastocatellia bacterium]|nr:penicillin acylase family protein [Blastocatellia bacterium]
MIKKILFFVLASVLMMPVTMVSSSSAQRQPSASDLIIAGLKDRAQVIVDRFGVPHVIAKNDHDAYLMMGYLHAKNRFFQMDVTRRRADGTLAELLGPGPNDRILESDAQLRVMGIARAAERSIKAYPEDFLALLQAYAYGVNAWLDANSLPPEYASVEITRVPRWTALDSVVVSKFLAFQLAFDFSDLRNTTTIERYKKAGQEKGFDGVKLFFDDLFRVTPFDTVITVSEPGRKRFVQTSSRKKSPGRNAQEVSASSSIEGSAISAAYGSDSRAASSDRSAGARAPRAMPAAIRRNAPAYEDQLRRSLDRISPQNIEAARRFVDTYTNNPMLNHEERGFGSNLIVVSKANSATGVPLLANDPHVALSTPAAFFEIHLTVESSPGPAMNVYGITIAGAPGIIFGHNETIAWGATSCPLDVTDFYSEKLVKENGVIRYTRYKDKLEPVVTIPLKFKVNQPKNGTKDDLLDVAPGLRESKAVDVPESVIVLPRRNHGPLIPSGPDEGIGVQFAGFSPSRELQALYVWARAKSVEDFKKGLNYFDFGAQNWGYADVNGNIAYFVGGKVPIREDLDSGSVDGLPPIFLRDGSGKSRHEWKAKAGVDPEKELAYGSLPFEEMPQEINPPEGYIINANNDPLGLMVDNDPFNDLRASGKGLYYISLGFNPGFRAWKLTSLVRRELDSPGGKAKVTLDDLRRIQSNVEMRDAEVFMPYIISAMRAARAEGAPAQLAAFAKDAGVTEAVGRLAEWDFTTPTGIAEGYDAGDVTSQLRKPSEKEIKNSVAATIFNVWRSRILHNTIIGTLDRLGIGNLQPGSDRELVALRYWLDNFSAGHGIGASGLNFFDVPNVKLAPEVERDIILLTSVREALDQLAGDQFAAAFNKSTKQDDYRWGKLHRITFMHIFGPTVPQFSIPDAGGFQSLSKTLVGLSVDGGYETIDNGNYDGRSTGANGYLYGGGSACRFIAELNPKGVKSLQVLPGGQNADTGDPFFSDQMNLWLTNRYHEVYFTQRDLSRNTASTQRFRPRR